MISEKVLRLLLKIIIRYLYYYFFFSFCWWSLTPKNVLSGVWQGETETIEIFSNGRINISGSGGGSYVILDNPYTILGMGRAEVRLDGIGAILGPVVIDYQVSAKWLDLTQGKSTQTYERISTPPIIRSSLEWLSSRIDGVI